MAFYYISVCVISALRTKYNKALKTDCKPVAVLIQIG